MLKDTDIMMPLSSVIPLELNEVLNYICVENVELFGMFQRVH